MELVRFGRNWSGLVGLGRVWSGLVAFGRAWCLKWPIYGSFMSLWCCEGQLHPSLGPPHTHTHTTNDRSCSTVIDHDRPWSTVVGLDQPADHCWARPNIFAGDHERSPCKSVRVRPWSTMIDLTDYQIVWLWSTVIDHVIDLYRPCDRPWSTVIDHVIDHDRPWLTGQSLLCKVEHLCAREPLVGVVWNCLPQFLLCQYFDVAIVIFYHVF